MNLIPFRKKYKKLDSKSNLKQLQVYQYRNKEGSGYLCKPGNVDWFIISETYEDLSLLDDPVTLEYLLDLETEYKENSD